MTQILIALYEVDGTAEEIVILEDLISNELDRCPECKEIRDKTGHLLYYCTTCWVRRDDRWLQSISRRAHAAVSPRPNRILQ